MTFSLGEAGGGLGETEGGYPFEATSSIAEPGREPCTSEPGVSLYTWKSADYLYENCGVLCQEKIVQGFLLT